MNKVLSKVVASGILTTMVLGLVAWGGTEIVENKTQIASLKQQNESLVDILKDTREDIKEIRGDIKLLLQRGNQ